MLRGHADRFTDLALIARASVDLIRIDGVLRRSGFQEMLATLDSIPTRESETLTRGDVQRARRYGRRIALAARANLPRAKCLHRSLVLHMWLRNEGLPSDLRIGVRKDGDTLRAHAWVEIAGSTINDSARSLRSFSVLKPSASRTPAGAAPDTPAVDLRNAQWQ